MSVPDLVWWVCATTGSVFTGACCNVICTRAETVRVVSIEAVTDCEVKNGEGYGVYRQYKMGGWMGYSLHRCIATLPLLGGRH